ncbi:MAG: polysaccharide export protein [Leptolyngbyaceae cyanobacterium T60_A2020_046]|nr:polysaccharide export protein [Leptolyngbyaceae cyanobacterium T60_A2020_046]
MPPKFAIALGLGILLGAMGSGPSLVAQAQPIFTAPLPSPQTVPVSDSAYILGAGDQISIIVIGYEEFNGTRVVLPDGTIAMPLIGSLRVAGQTIDAVSERLTTELRQYVLNPVVSVSLATLRPVVVTVAGEVYRPGPVQLSSLTSTNQRLTTDATLESSASSPTLSQALIAAGGIRRNADIRAIVVNRQLPTGQTEAISINLWESLTSGRVAADLILRDGDTIYVPTASAIDPLDQQLLASSTLAPDQVRVRVVGEVNAPGEVAVPPNSSVSSAVAIAGGPTNDAQLRRVVLIRRDEASGQIVEESLDLSNLIDTFQIQDGDVVWVPKRGYLTALDNVGRVSNTLLLPFGFVNLLQNIGILGD